MTEAAPESRLLAGEIAVVTGAAQGIGRGVAEVLAAAGATVAVADLDGAGARELASRLPGDCEGFAVDVRSEDAVAELEVSVRERLGIATLLVNNAGVQRTVPTSEMTTEDWDHVIDTNLAGTYRGVSHF